MRRRNAARSWQGAAPLFAALGDETRLRVVARLSAEGPLSIAKLTQGGRLTRQAVTKHLRVLADAGLVTGTRDGRQNVYELEPSRMAEAQRLLDVVSKQWDDTLENLRELVERKGE